MKLTVSHYWPLLLLVAVPFLWRMRRRSETGLSPPHSKVSTLARSVVILFLTLALMQPVWHRSGHWVSVVYVLDVSWSVAPEFIDEALDWMSAATQKGSPSQARYVAFATDPHLVDEVTLIPSLPVTSTVSGRAPSGVLVQTETNIESALRQSLQDFAPHTLKRLVLLSDGNQTTGDVMNAVLRAKRAGVRIFTIPAEVRAEGDGWIKAIELPQPVMAEEPLHAEVIVFSRRATPAIVELRRYSGAVGSPSRETGSETGTLLARRTVDLAPGTNRIGFDVQLPDDGLAVLEGSLDIDDDPFRQNDDLSRAVTVSRRAKVLYVEGRSETARYLRDALSQSGLDVKVSSPTGLPSNPGPLDDYDAVILSDVPARDLSQDQMLALTAYVGDRGGGLLFAGGETSYGSSGYSNTPLEEILPVQFRVQEKRRDLALVITLDKSYSMVGRKIDLAKEAAKAALDLLEDTHQFGLITFNWDPYVTVPLQPAKNRLEIREEIGKIQASAQTNIFGALQSSFRQLADSDAKVKHIILLSDGKTYPDDYEGLVARMREAEITISTVAAGVGADRELLERIAKWGHGRSYVAVDADRVPQIFIEETLIAVQTTLVEEPFRPRIKRRAELLAGIDFSSAPPLLGYASTQPKDTAEVLLESETGAPILARWQYGLGKVAAFTSDVKNRWAVEWLDWPGYGKFWSQLVRETMRRDDSGFHLRARRVGRRARIELSAVDDRGHNVNGLEPRLRVVTPSGEQSEQSFPQIAPGVYGTEIALTVSELPHLLEVTSPDMPSRSEALFYEHPDEYRLYPTNVELLKTISKETGGKFDPEIDDIFADRGETVSRPTALWPLLAGLGLAIYLFDIALRRAPWFWKRFEPRSNDS